MTAGGPVPWDPRLSAWLDQVEAAWASAGLSPLACGELRARLVEDLVQTVADGAPVDDLIGGDPVGFATDVASAAGYEPAPPRVDLTPATLVTPLAWRGVSRMSDRSRFVMTALAGALVGAALGWMIVYPVGGLIIDRVDVGYRTEGLLAVALWSVMALISAVSAGIAVSMSFRDSALRRRLGRTASLALLISGLAIVLPTMAFAWTTGYSTDPGVVMLEAGTVVLALVVGLIAAGELTQRRVDRTGRAPDVGRWRESGTGLG